MIATLISAAYGFGDCANGTANDYHCGKGGSIMEARHFTLTIELGNEAMRSPGDVAGALRRAANTLEDGFSGWHEISAIRDENGSTVGSFYVTGEGE